MISQLKKLRTENAILNIVLATIFFAIMNALVKHLSNIPFVELVFFRALISSLITYFVLRANNIPLKPNNFKMMFARGFTGTIGMVLFFYTIQKMPLASSVTLQHLAPIFTVIIATFLFREPATILQWFFIVTAFVGVIFVKGFDARVGWLEVTLGVMGAVASGFSYNLIRKMKDSEPSLKIVFYFPVTTMILVAPFMFSGFLMPSLYEWGLLLILGSITFAAQFFMTKAYQARAPGYITVFNYLGVFYASIIGYYVFNEKLSLLALSGIFIIVVSVVLSTLSSNRKNRIKNGKDPAQPPQPSA